MPEMTDLPFAALAGLLGLVVGSFLNVVIHRLPRMMEAAYADEAALQRGEPPPRRAAYNLWTPRSGCPSCGSAIRPWHNVPVLSFLALRGRCAGCSGRIALRYPVVEALSGTLSALVALRFGWGLPGAAALVLTWYLVALSFIDLDTLSLPDALTLPLTWIGLLVNLEGGFVPLAEAVAGAVAGYLILWSVYWAFRLVTGREGMGYGDFKLLAALGAWLGWKLLLPIVLLSAAAGALVGIGLIVFARHGRSVPIPYGPYLAVAGFIALVGGRSLTFYLAGG